MGLALVTLPSLYVLLYGVAKVRRGLRLRSAEPDPVQDALGGGRADLQGTAEPLDGTLSSPWDGESVLAYDYEVRSSKGKDQQSTTYESGQEAVDFLLSTADGTVLVPVEEAMVRVVGNEVGVKVEYDSDAPATGPPDDRIRSTGDTWDYSYYEEDRLLPGETAHVTGAVHDPARVDRTVPRGVDGVAAPVRNADGDGLAGTLRSGLRPEPMAVTDEPLGGTAKYQLWAGALVGLLGLLSTYLCAVGWYTVLGLGG